MAFDKNQLQVIEKVHPSSFAETDLHEHLRDIGGQKLLLCGYMVSTAAT